MSYPTVSNFHGPYRWLSNFYRCRIEYGRDIYPTVEHAYQAAKTLDRDWQFKVLLAETPGEAKRLGRKLPIRDDWDDVKLDVMYELVKQKFYQPPLRAWLLKTGDGELIEGNTWGDTFWGVCRGQGENHLGKIIMRVREELQTSRFGV